MRSGRHRGLPFQRYKNSATAANKPIVEDLSLTAVQVEHIDISWSFSLIVLALSLSLHSKFYTSFLLSITDR